MVSSEFKAAPEELLKSTKCNYGGKYLYILTLNKRVSLFYNSMTYN